MTKRTAVRSNEEFEMTCNDKTNSWGRTARRRRQDGRVIRIKKHKQKLSVVQEKAQGLSGTKWRISDCGQASLHFEKHSHSSRHIIFWCARILCVAVITCKNSDHRKSDLWHSFIEAVSLSITNKRIN